MAGSYSQIYLQIVISVYGRRDLLRKPWREEVFKYISGIITAKGQKSIIVNGVEDHVHIFVGLKPSIRISDLVRDIKNNSSKFINEQGFLNSKFSWQKGYGVFSYSQSAVSNVYKYIANQEAHHQKQSFKDEYLDFLKQFEVEYEDQYLFEWVY